jgi:hypothetical protein
MRQPVNNRGNTKRCVAAACTPGGKRPAPPASSSYKRPCKVICKGKRRKKGCVCGLLLLWERGQRVIGRRLRMAAKCEMCDIEMPEDWPYEVCTDCLGELSAAIKLDPSMIINKDGSRDWIN